MYVLDNGSVAGGYRRNFREGSLARRGYPIVPEPPVRHARDPEVEGRAMGGKTPGKQRQGWAGSRGGWRKEESEPGSLTAASVVVSAGSLAGSKASDVPSQRLGPSQLGHRPLFHHFAKISTTTRTCTFHQCLPTASGQAALPHRMPVCCHSFVDQTCKWGA